MAESLGSLPMEVLIKVAQECVPSARRSLCKVSKYMDSAARQELYRAIAILVGGSGGMVLNSG
jgi:hypothetical protein